MKCFLSVTFFLHFLHSARRFHWNFTFINHNRTFYFNELLRNHRKLKTRIFACSVVTSHLLNLIEISLTLTSKVFHFVITVYAAVVSVITPCFETPPRISVYIYLSNIFFHNTILIFYKDLISFFRIRHILRVLR